MLFKSHIFVYLVADICRSLKSPLSCLNDYKCALVTGIASLMCPPKQSYSQILIHHTSLRHLANAIDIQEKFSIFFWTQDRKTRRFLDKIWISQPGLVGSSTTPAWLWIFTYATYNDLSLVTYNISRWSFIVDIGAYLQKNKEKTFIFIFIK